MDQPEAPPKWNSWIHFHERDTTSAIAGNYYIEEGQKEFLPDIDPETYESGLWFSTKDHVEAKKEIPEGTSEAEKQRAKEEMERKMVLNINDIRQLTTLQLITHSRNHNLANDDQAGSGTSFEIAICDKNGKIRTRNGQRLSWLSHRNFRLSDDNEWCRGKVFMKGDDELFRCLKSGDVISVYMAVDPHHRNHAEVGYLVFGFGNGPMTAKMAKLRSDRDDRAPSISVYARERQECLMVPADDGSTEVKANIVQGGLHLLRRLLETEENEWKLEPYSLWPPKPVKGNDRPPNDPSPTPPKPVNRNDPPPNDPPPPTPPNFDSVIELVKGKNTIPPLRVVRHSTIKNTGDSKFENDPNSPKITVWDDFEVNKAEEITVSVPNAKILIYQMHAPLWSGNLWKQAVAHAEKNTLAAPERKDVSTIVVIDADDLRADGIRISRGISWEKTMEDFKAKIDMIYDKIVKCFDAGDRQAKLLTIKKHVHLLVRCGYEGVFHVQPRPNLVQPNPNEGQQTPKEVQPFVFHMVPNMAEGDLLRPYKGYMSGIYLAFLAGLAASLARQPVTAQPIGRTEVGLAIELAIIWSNRFATTGFCEDGDRGFNYPKAKDINHYRTPKIRVTYGDHSKIKDAGQWSLFNILEAPQVTVAAEVVKLGTERLEASVPTAKFGGVQTADRTEIEGYRSTAAVIQEYLNGTSKKPLSIAVFGQPGAGKSFGLKEVITAVMERGEGWKPIEANISQFLDYSDLVRVFHQIRDTALGGEKTPVVLFDEFDSSFDGKPLGWLKYFLAPMQDGVFLDSGSIRPLGRAIFVFIGGTSYTFKEFKNGKEVAAFEEAVADKEVADKEFKDAEDKKKAADKKYELVGGKEAMEKAKAKKEAADKKYNSAAAEKEAADKECGAVTNEKAKKEAETKQKAADESYKSAVDEKKAADESYKSAVDEKKAADKEYRPVKEAQVKKEVADKEYDRAKADRDVANKEYDRITGAAKKADADQTGAGQTGAGQTGADQTGAEKEAADKVAAYKEAAEKVVADKAAADKAAGRDPDHEDKQAKKPDFVSRLRAHINVRGPNQNGIRDRMFVMRRAMILSSQLRMHFGVDSKHVQVDNTVLNALLNHKSFPNGNRSIELILHTSRLSGRRRFESSDLASDEQLSMHVGDNIKEFHDLVDKPIALEEVRPVDVDLANRLMWIKLPKDKN